MALGGAGGQGMSPLLVLNDMQGYHSAASFSCPYTVGCMHHSVQNSNLKAKATLFVSMDWGITSPTMP